MIGGGSNLPPGCRASDIPGNRPEEQALEAAEQDCIDSLGEICHLPEDYDSVAQIARAVLPLIQRARTDAYSAAMADFAQESGGQ